ncbi:hypothetical protein HYW17_04465 [Candidatus Uhrbacteria bacterium]|nr:hypothetical protein [Candidatus Uhrbacteria bacterium]
MDIQELLAHLHRALTGSRVAIVTHRRPSFLSQAATKEFENALPSGAVVYYTSEIVIVLCRKENEEAVQDAFRGHLTFDH